MCEEDLSNSKITQPKCASDQQAILLEQYKIAVDFLQFEANTLWQIFNTFFLGNSIFLVAVFGLFGDKYHNYCFYLVVGIIGLLVCVLWLGTFRRNSDWYAFRMKQAKKAEKRYLKSVSDKEWYLLNKKAHKFADGKRIKGFKNNNSGFWMILLYMLIYLGIILWASFKLTCNA
jgi:hypothetical protein